jgi:hypothetical protein
VLRVPEEEEEIHDMKNRKRAARMVATVVASLALAFSVAAPASATNWGVSMGQLNCPSFMVAHVSFTASGAGMFHFYGPTATYSDSWYTHNATHRYTAPYSGHASYSILSLYGYPASTFTNVYATCSV